MHDATRHHSLTAIPTPLQSARAVQRTHELFSRTLACWASDVLALRRAGVLRLSWDGATRRQTPWSKAA